MLKSAKTRWVPASGQPERHLPAAVGGLLAGGGAGSRSGRGGRRSGACGGRARRRSRARWRRLGRRCGSAGARDARRLVGIVDDEAEAVLRLCQAARGSVRGLSSAPPRSSADASSGASGRGRAPGRARSRPAPRRANTSGEQRRRTARPGGSDAFVSSEGRLYNTGEGYAAANGSIPPLGIGSISRNPLRKGPDGHDRDHASTATPRPRTSCSPACAASRARCAAWREWSRTTATASTC